MEKLYNVCSRSGKKIEGPWPKFKCQVYIDQALEKGASPGYLQLEPAFDEETKERAEMSKVGKVKVVTFRCTQETYCLLREFAAVKGWTISYYCQVLMSRLANENRFLLYQGGGEHDG